jgi:hypothetical protein
MFMTTRNFFPFYSAAGAAAAAGGGEICVLGHDVPGKSRFRISDVLCCSDFYLLCKLLVGLQKAVQPTARCKECVLCCKACLDCLESLVGKHKTHLVNDL